MTVACEGTEIEMAKKKSAPPPDVENPDRVTLLNLKGDRDEKDILSEWALKTGVPLSEIARRGMTMWATQRKLRIPKGWVMDS